MTGKWEVKKGEFIRATSSFRNWITKDGSPGPTGEGCPARQGTAA